MTFDLPDPFGPTITDTPGVNSSFVRSGNDLNPLRAIERRCTLVAHPVVGSEANKPKSGDALHYSSSSIRSSASEAASCSACFLVRPEPRPIVSPRTSAAATKFRSCGGPSSLSMR